MMIFFSYNRKQSHFSFNFELNSFELNNYFNIFLNNILIKSLLKSNLMVIPSYLKLHEVRLNEQEIMNCDEVKKVPAFLANQLDLI